MPRSEPAAENAEHDSRNPRVDAYIAGAAPFAQPILVHLRALVHATCPDAVEDIKWRMPFFVYRGGNLCHMAAFKAHCAFGFWRARDIPELPTPEAQSGPAAAMGSIGRILSLDDLPGDRALTGFIEAAMKLAEAGGKPSRATTPTKPAIPMPSDVAGALAANADAARHFAAFSPACRREYLEWILEAKKPETRAGRIATLVELATEGKSSRHWKHRS